MFIVEIREVLRVYSPFKVNKYYLVIYLLSVVDK